MIRLLLYIKHNLPFLWRFAEKINGTLFRLLYKMRFEKVIPEVFGTSSFTLFTVRQLVLHDLESLEAFLVRQPGERVKYFSPHRFDYSSLLAVYNNPGFFMFGVFKEDEMAGYFFLRCFWNRKCFVGRLIDSQYEGRGIGKEMNRVMYNTGWRAGFRVLSTISRNNNLVMRSHSSNPFIVILKELQDNYMLVEFLPRESGEL